MTPRYRNDRYDFERYVGGVGKYDLWARPESFRVVWGDRVSEWDSYYFSDGEYHHNEDGRPKGEDHENIMAYLRCFVPEFSEALTKEENEHDK